MLSPLQTKNDLENTGPKLSGEKKLDFVFKQTSGNSRATWGKISKSSFISEVTLVDIIY